VCVWRVLYVNIRNHIRITELIHTVISSKQLLTK